MQNCWFVFVCLIALISRICCAEPEQISRPVRYMADSQNYADAINFENPSNTLEESNLLLMKQLGTLYHHDFVSQARIQFFMDNGEAVCVPNKIKTPERAAKYIFSQPVNLHLSHRLYQLQSMQAVPYEVLNEQGEIKSLNSLFAALPQQSLLIPFQRSFGAALDQQIALLPDANKVVYRGGDLHDTEIDMFIKQRGNFLLTYPVTIFSNSEVLGDLPIRSYAIANHPKYIISRVMCADTPETRQHIRNVNRALDVLYAKPELLNAHLKWLPESEHDTIKAYYLEATQEF